LGISVCANQLTPLKIRLKQKIISIVCGNDHSLALNSQGEVFSWGKNLSGQCGQDEFKDCLPKKVQNLEKIAFLACGKNHSLVIGENQLSIKMRVSTFLLLAKDYHVAMNTLGAKSTSNKIFKIKLKMAGILTIIWK